jgi:outer membrane lipoprotein-sorting protein
LYHDRTIIYYEFMRVNFRSGALILVFLFGVFFPVFSQEIVTAEKYLESVSERYGGIRDYEAQVLIRSGSTDMIGSLSFLDPHFLRIDFSKPSGQVLVFNGEILTVYIPELRAILNQAVAPARRSSTSAMGASLASAQGLQLLRRGYVPSFVTGPAPVPLEDRSREMVIKLRLTRRLSSEGFRELIVSVDPETRLIRRIEGRTIAEALVRFDFNNIRINLGIPEQRFIYDSPASANLYNNFLFRDSD